jgi:hypothetical protein
MNKETGGQAFPSTMTDDSLHVAGMTLRDYFAAAAIPTLVAYAEHDAHADGLCTFWLDPDTEAPGTSSELVAQDAYAIADAMLNEGSK